MTEMALCLNANLTNIHCYDLETLTLPLPFWLYAETSNNIVYRIYGYKEL